MLNLHVNEGVYYGNVVNKTWVTFCDGCCEPKMVPTCLINL